MENKYANAVDFFKTKQKNAVGIPSNLMLAAYELRTPENLGAMIRLAGNLGISKVIFIQSEQALKTSKIAKVAHSSFKHVDYSFCTPEEFFTILPKDFEVVAVETSEKAANLFTSSLPSKCVLLVGNERYGIDQEFLNQIEKTVYIPLLGKTLSMNVSHAATIAAFEWGRQHLGLEKM
ncbi:MAG: TrmH family RNA methyltransferase [Bacteroidales bacterium]|jgi:tRNA G18 (ribose-2'-O)-methylase SpoU|nr:TrmH family RNA methyltransferase [Bacteroidales bacterium]